MLAINAGLSGMLRLAVLLALLLVGCASPGLERAGAPTRGPQIYVAAHGWHSGLIVRTADLPPGAWPAQRYFPDAQYLELGWGDREYYRSRNFSLWLATRAALWPTDSAVHVVGFSSPIDEQFPGSELVMLQASRAGFRRLVEFVAATFEGGEGAVLGPGQRENSLFFASHRRFHLFENCNTWVAHALREAGVPVSTRGAITAEGLLSQLRRQGGM